LFIDPRRHRRHRRQDLRDGIVIAILGDGRKSINARTDLGSALVITSDASRFVKVSPQDRERQREPRRASRALSEISALTAP